MRELDEQDKTVVSSEDEFVVTRPLWWLCQHAMDWYVSCSLSCSGGGGGLGEGGIDLRILLPYLDIIKSKFYSF